MTTTLANQLPRINLANGGSMQSAQVVTLKSGQQNASSVASKSPTHSFELRTSSTLPRCYRVTLVINRMRVFANGRNSARCSARVRLIRLKVGAGGCGGHRLLDLSGSNALGNRTFFALSPFNFG